MSRYGFFVAGQSETDSPSLDPLNGWFWPVPPTAPAAVNTPVGLSPTAFFGLQWNIRRLRIVGSISIAPVGGGSTYGFSFDVVTVFEGEYILPAYPGGPDVLPVYTERDILVPRKFQRFIPASATDYLKLTVDMAKFAYTDTAPPQYFRPDFLLEVGPAINVRSYKAAPSDPVSAFSASFLGVSLPMYETAGGDTASGSVTITAHEYWEYRDAAGNNPAFSSTTGSQLITPIPLGL